MKKQAKPKPEPKTNPIAKFKDRRFVCSRWPYLGLGGGVKFEAGHLTVTSQEQADRVERTDAFQHGQIVEIREKKNGQEPSIEESAELAALEQLQQLKPKARMGAVSTNTMAG